MGIIKHETAAITKSKLNATDNAKVKLHSMCARGKGSDRGAGRLLEAAKPALIEQQSGLHVILDPPGGEVEIDSRSPHGKVCGSTPARGSRQERDLADEWNYLDSAIYCSRSIANVRNGCP